VGVRCCSNAPTNTYGQDMRVGSSRHRKVRKDFGDNLVKLALDSKKTCSTHVHGCLKESGGHLKMTKRGMSSPRGEGK